MEAILSLLAIFVGIPVAAVIVFKLAVYGTLDSARIAEIEAERKAQRRAERLKHVDVTGYEFTENGLRYAVDRSTGGEGTVRTRSPVAVAPRMIGPLRIGCSSTPFFDSPSTSARPGRARATRPRRNAITGCFTSAPTCWSSCIGSSPRSSGRSCRASSRMPTSIRPTRKSCTASKGPALRMNPRTGPDRMAEAARNT